MALSEITSLQAYARLASLAGRAEAFRGASALGRRIVITLSVGETRHVTHIGSYDVISDVVDEAERIGLTSSQYRIIQVLRTDTVTLVSRDTDASVIVTYYWQNVTVEGVIVTIPPTTTDPDVEVVETVLDIPMTNDDPQTTFEDVKQIIATAIQQVELGVLETPDPVAPPPTRAIG